MMVDWLFTNLFGSGMSTVKYAYENTNTPAMKLKPVPKMAILIIFWRKSTVKVTALSFHGASRHESATTSSSSLK